MRPAPARTETAMARSVTEPDLGNDAGDRLTVMRRAGQAKPDEDTAARTRSRASLRDVSGSPTKVNAGSDGARCDSTSMTWPVTPVSTTDKARPIMRPPAHV